MMKISLLVLHSLVLIYLFILYKVSTTLQRAAGRETRYVSIFITTLCLV